MGAHMTLPRLGGTYWNPWEHPARAAGSQRDAGVPPRIAGVCDHDGAEQSFDEHPVAKSGRPGWRSATSVSGASDASLTHAPPGTVRDTALALAGLTRGSSTVPTAAHAGRTERSAARCGEHGAAAG